MDNLILTAIVTALTFGLITYLTGIFIFIFEKRKITKLIRSYFDSPDEETPSQFAVLIDTISRVFAARIVHQVKSTVAGMNSVDSKNEQKAVVNEIMAGSPGLAALSALLPKRWMRNKEVIGALSGLFAKKPGGNNEGPKEVQNIFKL